MKDKGLASINEIQNGKYRKAALNRTDGNTHQRPQTNINRTESRRFFRACGSCDLWHGKPFGVTGK